MKINKALSKKKGMVKEISAINLTRELYYKEYQGYLFCAEDGCKAKLNFVQTKRNVKYFRTNPSTDHKEGCPNEVEYDETLENHIIRFHEKRINISNGHINDTLDRAFDKFINNSVNRQDFNKEIKKTHPNKGKNDGTIGGAELFDDGIDSEDGKEPYISTRMYNKIDKADDNKIRCIIGYVHNIQLMDKHGYINLTPRTANSVKIHFAEYFVVNNESEFNNMNIIKSYIKLMKSKKEAVICCCVGRIKYVNSGINIILDRYQGFILNGMKFYEILSYMNDYKNII